MSVLRKIGRFFGKTIKKVGDVVGAVARPLNAIATPLKPLLMATPMGRAAVAGLDVASGVADVAKMGGSALLNASGGRSVQNTASAPPV